ncbi:hypothetical protein ACFLU5_04815 [Bacteroidota bacterium]
MLRLKISIVLLSTIALIAPLKSNAQEILDFSFDSESKPEHLIIKYLLVSETDNESFFIEIHANYPDSTVLLKEVSGDVGSNITSGMNTIDWDYEKEILHFEGNIQFTFKIEYMIQLLNENGIRRGKSNQLKLYESIDTDTLNFYLYHPNIETNLELTYTQSGDTVDFLIPKKVKKKSGYQLLIDRVGEDNDMYSKQFTIKRKIAHFLKVLPVLLAGAYIGYKQYDKITEPLPQPPIDQVE